jgi:hypothetical protein
VNQRLSLLAAAVSLAGIAGGPLFRVNPLPLFGIYCGWLTFLSPSLASQLSPYNYAPGVSGASSGALARQAAG